MHSGKSVSVKLKYFLTNMPLVQNSFDKSTIGVSANNKHMRSNYMIFLFLCVFNK